MAEAQAAGALIVKPAHETFWGGCSGYFQDPDGHLWEVALNRSGTQNGRLRPAICCRFTFDCRVTIGV
jgi:hypothetical protein